MVFVKANWRFFTVLVLALLFAFFVWPTKYEYISTPYDWTQDDVKRPTRVDRITGHIQVYLEGRWYDVRDGSAH